mmetsp:Transcript_21060/g.59521  ORF Transcript_21060/g.59521 Transcript_21060/m.59521 type:complete len:213 (-) Transcript_21060:6-644(-)
MIWKSPHLPRRGRASSQLSIAVPNTAHTAVLSTESQTLSVNQYRARGRRHPTHEALGPQSLRLTRHPQTLNRSGHELHLARDSSGRRTSIALHLRLVSLAFRLWLMLIVATGPGPGFSLTSERPLVRTASSSARTVLNCLLMLSRRAVPSTRLKPILLIDPLIVLIVARCSARPTRVGRLLPPLVRRARLVVLRLETKPVRKHPTPRPPPHL